MKGDMISGCHLQQILCKKVALDQKIREDVKDKRFT